MAQIKVLNPDPYHVADLNRWRQVIRAEPHKPTRDEAHLQEALVTQCVGEEWMICPNHAQWAAYCFAGAAIAAATDVIIKPPPDFDDWFDENLELAVWPELDSALAIEPSAFSPVFRKELRLLLVPQPHDCRSSLAFSWRNGFFGHVRDRQEAVAYMDRAILSHGREWYDRLPDMRQSIDLVAKWFPIFRSVYEERRFPRLVRAIETDHAVRVAASCGLDSLPSELCG